MINKLRVKTFNYQVIEPNGLISKGTIDAESKQHAQTKLRQRNNLIINVRQQNRVIKIKKMKKITKKIQLLQQIQQLLQAQTPMVEIIQIIKSLNHTQEKMAQGLTLSQSINNEWLSHSERQILAMGEKSGEIASAIQLIISKNEGQIKRRSQIKKIMAYPLMVLIIAIVTCAGMLINIVPQFQQLFESFNAKLPKSTILLIQFSHALTHHATLILSFFTISVIIFIGLFQYNNQFNQKLKHIIITFPFIRNLSQLSFKNEWASLLAICLNANIPFNEAFILSFNLSPINTWKKDLENALKQIQSGSTIAHGLAQQAWLNHQDLQMIRIGEKSQQLGKTLQSIAQISQQELDRIGDNIQLWMEPITLLLISSIIGSILIALYSPIFKMGSII